MNRVPIRIAFQPPAGLDRKIFVKAVIQVTEEEVQLEETDRPGEWIASRPGSARRDRWLAAAAAMWQTRASHLDHELKQLTAGTSDPETEQEATRIAPEPPHAGQSSEEAPTGHGIGGVDWSG